MSNLVFELAGRGIIERDDRNELVPSEAVREGGEEVDMGSSWIWIDWLPRLGGSLFSIICGYICTSSLLPGCCSAFVFTPVCCRQK
jgi:hypothetical protein